MPETSCKHGCLISDHDYAGHCYRQCERCPDRCPETVKTTEGKRA